MKLLNIDANAKTIKSRAKGYLTGILYLAPADTASTPQLKINVCSMAELAGCKAPCLNVSGHAGIFKKGETTNAIQQARIKKTRWFFDDRAGFMRQLAKEIVKLVEKADEMGLKPAVRLNGTSDIKWENVRFEYVFALGKVRSVSIFELFPEVQFYDYTKIPNRGTEDNPLPANYHLTFSYSNRPEFQPYVQKALQNKRTNIAVVFDSKARVQDYVRSGASFKGMPVIDGDETDVRFADSKGVVVGLYAKGRAKQDYSGFVVRS